MADRVGFESQFTTVMQNVLKSAVCEATRLFEHSLQQLRAELVHLKEENVQLKTAAFTPHYSSGESGDGCPARDPAKRDIGVQCEKPTMVERCCSPAQFGDQSLLRPVTNDHLSDLCACSSEDGNRQLALLLIKKEPQETDCDEYAPGYFLLKQEGAEPILVRKDPFKNTMEKVEIPSALQAVSRCYETSKDVSTSNTSLSETTASCNFRTASAYSKVTQTTSISRCERAQERQENSAASIKTSTLPELHLANRQIDVPTSTVSASKPGLMSTPRIHQMTATTQRVENFTPNGQFGTPRPLQIFHNVQNSPAVTQFGPKLGISPFPPNKNPITGACNSIPVTSTNKIAQPAPVSKSVAPSVPFSQALKHSLTQTQTGIPSTQNMTVQGHVLGPRPQVSFPTAQHRVVHGQLYLSQCQNPPPSNQVPMPAPQVPVPPVNHAPFPPTQAHVQPNHIHQVNPTGLNIQGQLPVPHQNLVSLSQPNYSLNHVPFVQPFLPVQSMKSSASPASIPQTNEAPGYEMLPDPLCSSSEQLFSTPDTSDLLQSLAPVPFQSQVVLTLQETSPIMHSQLSSQPLQLAPLLTLKEQQEAVCNQGNLSKRGPNMPVEIPMPTSNHFEEQIARFQPLESPTMNPQNEDPVKSNDIREQHYTVLSKPGPPFIVSDSTKEHTFRMHIMKDVHLDHEANKQKPSCETTCQVWEACDFASVLAQSALGVPAYNTLHKASRKVLEKKTECSECGRILSNPSSLENHMRLHRGERPYTCSQCGKAFPSVRGLNRHVKVHAEEKGYKCEVCGRSFVYQFTLTKHKLIHSGDRPFPCKVCGKKFLAKADRATHMRMHTGEKPFFCNQCGKTFKHRVALNMHMQGHRGEKRYVCPHCEKGFVDLGNFKRHKRIHTGEKPFECKECAKRFTQSAHLKKHVNTQHLAQKQNQNGSTAGDCHGPGSSGQIVENSFVMQNQLLSLDSGEPVEKDNVLDACP